MDIRPVDPEEHPEAARIITDALLDDPGWLGVGPDNRDRRRRVLLAYHRAVVRVTAKHGGPIYGAYRDGRLAAVAGTLSAGLPPPPGHTFAGYVPPLPRARPPTLVGAVGGPPGPDKGHPAEAHHLLRPP